MDYGLASGYPSSGRDTAHTMSEFLRAKKVAQARDAERAKELERLKQAAEERKAAIEREAREREKRDREEEIAHLKRSRELENAKAAPNPLDVHPKSQKYQEPRGPGSVALHKIRADLKKPTKSSVSPSPGPSRAVPKPSSSTSQPLAGPSTTPRSHALPSKNHKAPTRNAPPKITARASQSHTARGKMSLEMAGQPILHALNQNKRDLRSIDEIERDIKAKRLALGRESDKVVVEKPKVNGFFDEPPPLVAPVKAKLPPAKVNAVAGSSTAGLATQKSGSASTSKQGERTNSGVPRSSSLPTSSSKTKPPQEHRPSSVSKSAQPVSSTSALKSTNGSSKAPVKSTASTKPIASSSSSPKPTRKVLPPPKPKVQVPAKRRERDPSTSSESETDSEEEYARRRSRMGRRSPPPGPGKLNASEEIWKLFGRGKTKQDYLARDLSDSGSDMEVSAEQLAREEARTARIAREEDARAEAEERRHAEAKRRRLGKK